MSSTTTTPTTPTPPVAPPAPTFNSIFQSPGGPPLILVCIAAGLLLGAFLGILLMRRMRPTVAVQGTPGLRGFPDPQKTLGEKPKLLDVHIVPRADSAYMTSTGAGGWGGVSPFAALYLPSPETSATPGPSPIPSRTEIWRRRVLALVPDSLRPSRRSHDPHASHKSAAGTGTPSVRAVQLAVTVSMPSPHPFSFLAPYRSTGTGKKPEKEKWPANECEKDPLSVNVSPVNGRTDPPDDAKHAAEPPVPDCCIGTLVVHYRPPPGPVEPGTAAAP
ncbi:hypothetical protein K466DRAFT_595185 [Polyporus arcularius HHB13444]|uniref:Uncharacterized protein n=1 Tax=Polyporus arcularius HHB13444 TaxID=1314778 RepID=A0A5C3PSZ3_9APHY|nr:hypothetical protein K466DRAFT_595185 [Polyporus arcularius HHB13444]